ncbi:MAG: AmmeMemoRadiSam system protein B [Gammaproteobacteria bacterium]|nr:MAG: AmmeMemoRadiSam system protein B [Gammaproteobacteria bacterium]UCH38474.1 MAG: AmmeMemoRadiSam system protein B [Gammaproteobacteria bacterium]
MTTRQAAVAGYFYEADAGRLQQHVNQLLATDKATDEIMPKALIVPHAGYIYSGSTAAHAYRCLLLDPDRVRRVLLLGPAHRVYLAGMAIPSVDRFATPLGDIPLDRSALDSIARLPGVEVSDEAHREEHSLEVQLPFLQTVLNEFALVPVVVGGAAPDRVAAVIDELAEDPHTLVVISSDLSHFLSYRDAQQIDAATCKHILEKSTSLSGEEACGAHAINGLMASVRADTLEVSLLHACNSGDTAGSPNRVVGYAAFALH